MVGNRSGQLCEGKRRRGDHEAGPVFLSVARRLAEHRPTPKPTLPLPVHHLKI